MSEFTAVVPMLCVTLAALAVMGAEAFRAKTGYAPSAVEAALENMKAIRDRIERMQHTLPIPMERFLELAPDDPSAGEVRAALEKLQRPEPAAPLR